MKKSFLTISLIMALGCFAQAQDRQNQHNDDSCARFAMRVVKPVENVDPKMVLQVDANMDQAMVVNPCRPAMRLAEQTKPTLPESPRQQNSIAPSLRFRLPEGQVKSPSEVLKQFAAPKPNRD